MKKRFLGKTGIELSEIGFGCASLFGKDVLGKQGINNINAVVHQLFGESGGKLL